MNNLDCLIDRQKQIIDQLEIEVKESFKKLGEKKDYNDYIKSLNKYAYANKNLMYLESLKKEITKKGE